MECTLFITNIMLLTLKNYVFLYSMLGSEDLSENESILFRAIDRCFTKYIYFLISTNQ